ncbi:MAG: folate-binding protein YgfZ [Planctomycetota bacterium]
MTDTELHATLLANGPYVRDDAPFRLLTIAGPDAGSFLHKLCTQDVQGMPEGQVRPAAFLDAKGKLQVTAWVARQAETYWLEVQAHQAERLRELLDRYHFTEKLELKLLEAQPCRERVAAADGEASAVGTGTAEFGAAGAVTYRVCRRGVQFERGYGAAAASLAAAGEAMDEATAAALRMCAGIVHVGLETEANTLGLEADLDDHCSTTKGCYTGQEIVARIHTYGHVNRKLCLLQLAGEGRIEEPVGLLEPEDEIAVGRVLHAVPLAGVGGEAPVRLGLGYLPKDFQEVGTKLLLEGGEGGENAAVVVVGFA